MATTLNAAQAKLLAGFCSDLAKGLILAALSLPITIKASWPFVTLLVLTFTIVAIFFLRIGVKLLKEIKDA